MRLGIGILIVVVVSTVILWVAIRSRKEREALPMDSFTMPIDDVFALKIKGKVVVVGVVSTGEIHPGDLLTIRAGDNTIPVTVEALEAFHKPLKSAKAGDRIGIMLSGVDKVQVVLPAVLAGNK